MKTLIVYTSKYGTAEKCANNIGKELRGYVDIINLKDNIINTIDEYDNIIIICSIYAGKISKELRKFALLYQQDLKNKKIGILVCSKEGKEKINQYIKNNFPDNIFNGSFMIDHLGHEINLERMNMIEKFLLKKIFKVSETYSKVDYDKIKEVTKIINEMDVK